MKSPLYRIALAGVTTCLVGAVACSGKAPLLVDAGTDAASEATVDASADTGVPFIEIRLRRGQTLWDLARSYGVTTQQLREFNGLTPLQGRRLTAGQTIRIPGVEAPIEEMEDVDAGVDGGSTDTVLSFEDDAGTAASSDAGTTEGSTAAGEPIEGGYHTLADGETLWDLTRLYDVTLDDIARANQWDDDDTRIVVVGTRVLIPGVPQSRIRVTATRGPSVSTPRWGLRHQMGRGETIWTLSQRYNVSVAEIMAANRLTPASAQSLSLGQSIMVPGVVRRPDASQPERPISPAQERAKRLARRLGLGNRAAAQQLLHGRVQPKWIAAAGGRRGRLPGTLRWPVQNGRFSRGYGSGTGGYHLATDIMGDMGWNVRASAPGIVGYSGNELTGFGNVVLVIHPGGWVTLYAHNSINFVVAGQRVGAGTILAEVGSTGRSMGPHVHFELIFDGKNCNPNSLFRPGIRHRSGFARTVQTTWTDPRARPDAVVCAPRRRHPANDLPGNE